MCLALTARTIKIIMLTWSSLRFRLISSQLLTKTLINVKLATGLPSTGQAVWKMEEWSQTQEQNQVANQKLSPWAQVKLTSAGTSVSSSLGKVIKPLWLVHLLWFTEAVSTNLLSAESLFPRTQMSSFKLKWLTATEFQTTTLSPKLKTSQNQQPWNQTSVCICI